MMNIIKSQTHHDALSPAGGGAGGGQLDPTITEPL